MFTDFFYQLRSYGVKVSLIEWDTFLEALRLGLHQNSFTEFYYLARTTLIKKETDYDRFDQAFTAYFQNLVDLGIIPEAFEKWLEKAAPATPYNKEEVDRIWNQFTKEEINDLLEERFKLQKEQHNGGTTWVGTGGQTAFGHSGYAPKGIRIMGKGTWHSAFSIAQERHFRDFRDDTVLDIRQFQVGLRKLRRLSSQNEQPKDELDIDETIKATSNRGGLLDVIYKRPRKNQTRLLLLMDSGGSMWGFADLCRRLFQAVTKNNQFKDLKIFYFHNIFYDYLFTKPDCAWENRIDTEWVFHQYKNGYQVIIVGDARMGEEELMDVNGNIDYIQGNNRPGISWLEELLQLYPASIWLNPMREVNWRYYYTLAQIRKRVDMFPMTIKGLEASMDALRKKGTQV